MNALKLQYARYRRLGKRVIWMLLAGAAVVAIAFAIVRAVKRTMRWEDFASMLTADEANQAFQESCGIVIRQLADPIHSGISGKECNDHLERAVACKSRMNELCGKEYGPSFRQHYRPLLAKALKRKSDEISPYVK